MSHVSLNKYLEHCRREILDRCTTCGNCVINCEIRRFTALKDEHPIHIVEAMKSYIDSGEFSQRAYDYAFQCINCLECKMHCFEGIDASAFPLLTKERLVREGHDVPPMLMMSRPCQTSSVQNILNALQVAPVDRWWLDDVPQNPEPHDVVLFLGCNEMPFPSAMAATRDILARMGIDFVAVGGGRNLCCGAVHMYTGETGTAHDMGQCLVESLERFRPATVVFTCPTCTYVVQKTMSENSGSSVKYMHFARFLTERLDDIDLSHHIGGRATLQDPCFTGRGLGDYESPRKVLSAIKGVELVEMEHNRENALCCGVTALANNPPEVAEAFIRKRLEEATEAKADIIVNACAGCQMAFFGYEKSSGLRAKMFSEVVAEAMGIEVLPDRMKQFRDLKEPELIIKAARDAIDAGEYEVDQIMAILPFLFR